MDIKTINQLTESTNLNDKYSLCIDSRGITQKYALSNIINPIYVELDKKAETWYQDSDPRTSASWGNDEDRIGDMWCNTSGKTMIWNGNEWIQQGVPDDVLNDIDGKSSIFVSIPSKYQKRDLWILEKDYVLDKSYKSGTIVVATKDMDAVFNGSDWTKLDNYSDAKEVEDIKDNLQSLTNKVNAEFAGSFYIWQGENNDVPTLDNEPAINWTDELSKQVHVDDFYITSDGVVYQFKVNEGVFQWVKVDDKYIIPYVEQIYNKLLNTGIDIENNTITVSQNQFKVQDATGNPIAIFEIDETSGLPIIKGEYINVKYVNIANGAILLNTNGSGHLANGNISWDENGNVKNKGSIQTPWKTLISQATTDPETGELKYIFHGNGIYDDKLIVDGDGDLEIAWGELSDGKDMAIRTGMEQQSRSINIIIPENKKIVTENGEWINGPGVYEMQPFKIYYLTGFADFWVIKQIINLLNY